MNFRLRYAFLFPGVNSLAELVPSHGASRRWLGDKNKLNHIIKITKKRHYEEKLVEYKNEIKLIWATLNEIMNRTTHKHNLLPKEFSGNNPEDII